MSGTNDRRRFSEDVNEDQTRHIKNRPLEERRNAFLSGLDKTSGEAWLNSVFALEEFQQNFMDYVIDSSDSNLSVDYVIEAFTSSENVVLKNDYTIRKNIIAQIYDAGGFCANVFGPGKLIIDSDGEEFYFKAGSPDEPVSKFFTEVVVAGSDLFINVCGYASSTNVYFSRVSSSSDDEEYHIYLDAERGGLIYLKYEYGYIPPFAEDDDTHIKKEYWLTNISIEDIIALVNFKAGNGIEISDANVISVKLKPKGGLKFEEDELTGDFEISIDEVTEEVVETVQKLAEDLESQIICNFDMPNISNVYDFADQSVSHIDHQNGSGLLYQAFTVPINNKVKVYDPDNPDEVTTLLSVMAKNSYSSKVMFAIYVYNGDYTDYVCDTGWVSINAGMNHFPIRIKNPNIEELRSDCVYYASILLRQHTQATGLLLAGCPSYGTDNNLNTLPKMTVVTQNIPSDIIDPSNENDMIGLHTDGDNYIVGPWCDRYNEHSNVPRFFLMIRNGTYVPPEPGPGPGPGPGPEPSDEDPFSEDAIVVNPDELLSTMPVSEVFSPSFAFGQYNIYFQQVKPIRDCVVASWTVYDIHPNDRGYWGSPIGGGVYSSNFDAIIGANSNVDYSVEDLGEYKDGSGIYMHRYTPRSPLELTANEVYYFGAGYAENGNANDRFVTFAILVSQKTLAMFEAGTNISQWANYTRTNDFSPAPCIKITLTNGKEYILCK